MPPSSPKIWIAAAAGVAVLAVCAGAFVLSQPRAVGAGPLLNIAVVAPPEREVLPGGVMEVGQLIDGYVHQDPAPQSEPEVIDAWLPDDAFTYLAPSQAPAPIRAAEVEGARPYLPTTREVAPGSRETRPGRPLAFGFDEPRPDYAAEREARRARLDALEANALARAATGEAATAPDTFY